ncbi:hypothetical protein [Endozoicomonas sp. 2B-B]
MTYWPPYIGRLIISNGVLILKGVGLFGVYALLDKLGFEHEGLAKSYLKIAGKWQDHVGVFQDSCPEN